MAVSVTAVMEWVLLGGMEEKRRSRGVNEGECPT